MSWLRDVKRRYPNAAALLVVGVLGFAVLVAVTLISAALVAFVMS